MGFSLSGEKVLTGLRTDENLRRATQLVRHGGSELPSAAGRYVLQKVPVVQWIPKYSPRWLINDLIAGLTVGVILVPQALAYAKIAGIPLQDGLLASWLPSALYFIMGTSKDISVGPTSIIGLLTAQIIKQVSADGYTPTAIAVAIAFSVGVYCLVMGLLKLGFLLEFVSLPVLTGFISAAAITIILGQVPAIFGETNVGSGAANQIHDIFAKLPKTKPITFAVGISGIFLLCIMQYAGKKWGKTSKVVWIMSIGRNAITILLFSIISFFVNKDIKTPIFDLTGKIPAGLLPPKSPDLNLVGKVFQSSLAVFIAAALEHIAICKAFGRKNNYTIDQSQELTFLGVINILNSFFGGMAVGGAASRTAVNSESGVKSPLSGLFTTGAVLLSVYFLTGALFWIPKATLSAVIIVAVWGIIEFKELLHYWKVSFADFAASQIAFWVTLFVSAEEGIETASAFMVAFTVLSIIFSKGQGITKSTFFQHYPSSSTREAIDELPSGTALVKMPHPIIFLNASRAKNSILDAVQTYHSGAPTAFTNKSKNPDRMWSELGAQHIELLRRKAGIPLNEAEYLPQVRTLVLDLQGVTYMDMSGIQALKDMQTELKAYAGGEVEMRFVGLRENLVGKLQRAGWKLVGENVAFDKWAKESGVVLFGTVRDAVMAEGGEHFAEKDGSAFENEEV
ncbi:related to sulfate permease SutB [Phialocephala subalpina]|uniref:Related to sulfate permease SutB n=1 Tax=Phialocephala subalpina TaxID=576137 RepID=A0A1L7XKA5_9HELO|nr:related to sulfate permease SutB [Phialocephala subalpina]